MSRSCERPVAVCVCFFYLCFLFCLFVICYQIWENIGVPVQCGGSCSCIARYRCFHCQCGAIATFLMSQLLFSVLIAIAALLSFGGLSRFYSEYSMHLSMGRIWNGRKIAHMWLKQLRESSHKHQHAFEGDQGGAGKCVRDQSVPWLLLGNFMYSELFVENEVKMTNATKTDFD